MPSPTTASLAAAGRQGIDELGAALKAFPDASRCRKPARIWNPTQGEIAADREHARHSQSFFAGGPPHPWPSEIASQNRHQPGKDHGNGHENGHDAGNSM